MPEEHPHYATSDIVNPDTAHEESDVNVRAVVWFAVIFILFAIFTHIVVWFYYQGLIKHARGEADKTTPLTTIQRPADAAVPKNQPLLQPFPKKAPAGEDMAPNTDTPVTDLAKMRANEQKQLDNYGWIDRPRGVVRVPIEYAKRAVVQRGLAVQSQTPAAAPAPAPAAATPAPNAVQQPASGGAQ